MLKVSDSSHVYIMIYNTEVFIRFFVELVERFQHSANEDRLQIHKATIGAYAKQMAMPGLDTSLFNGNAV